MTHLDYALLRSLNVARCERHFHPIRDWSPEQWALATCGEAGEVCGAVKKLIRGDGTRVQIGEEVADVVIYTDIWLARMSWCNITPFADYSQGDLVSRSIDLVRFAANAASFTAQNRLRHQDLHEIIDRAGMVAGAAGIDLNAAVIRKFNAKSREIGSSHLLPEVA